MKTKLWKRVLFYILLFASVAIVVFPVYWLFVLSLQPMKDIYSSELILYPTLNPLEAYRQLIAESQAFMWISNTFKIAAVTIPFCILLAIPAAYGISFFRFKGKAPAMFSILLTQMLPSMFLLVPIYMVITRIHLGNTLWGLMIVDMTFVLPVTVWFLKGFCDGIPRGMIEAAIVDGCTQIGVVVRIVTPMLLPGIAAAATWALISVWNEYLFAFTLLSREKLYTVTVGLASQKLLFGTNFTVLYGGGFIATIPILIIFMFFQKYLVGGLTAGAVKE